MSFFDLLLISITDQRLYAYSKERCVITFEISTALNGAGERKGSGCTPRGWHQVRARIGEGLPRAAVLRGRRWTEEICSPELQRAQPERDWILTRILWLSGLEPGRNRLGECDTFARYIYIHGTPDSEPMGVPRSHGCVRVRNDDLLELFSRTPLHCLVLIQEEPHSPLI